MRAYLLIKYIRVLLFISGLLICASLLFSSNQSRTICSPSEETSVIEYDSNFQDNHLYPPPWFSSRATIYDYFMRKDRLKVMLDEEAIRRKHKIIIKDGFSKPQRTHVAGNRTYLIVEYTQVFGKNKFCGKTREIIFGQQCPYRNCE